MPCHVILTCRWAPRAPGPLAGKAAGSHAASCLPAGLFQPAPAEQGTLVQHGGDKPWLPRPKPVPAEIPPGTISASDRGGASPASLHSVSWTQREKEALLPWPSVTEQGPGSGNLCHDLCLCYPKFSFLRAKRDGLRVLPAQSPRGVQ